MKNSRRVLAWVLLMGLLFAAVPAAAVSPEIRLEAPRLSIPFNTLYTGLSFAVGVGSGYDHTDIQAVSGENSYSFETDGTEAWVGLSKAGVYALTAIGTRNGIQSEASEPVSITVVDAPAVTEITVEGAGSFLPGQDIQHVVLFPQGTGSFFANAELFSEAGESIQSTVFRIQNHCGIYRFYARDLLEAGIGEGNYRISITTDNGDSGEKLIELEGETLTAPSLTASSYKAMAGDSLQITGNGNSADAIYYSYYAEKNNSDGWENGQAWVFPEEDGSWAQQLDIPEGGKYTVEVTGYTDDGRCTGVRKISIVAEDVYSLPEPEISVNRETIFASQKFGVIGTADSSAEQVLWNATIYDENRMTVLSWESGAQGGSSFETSFTLAEEGTYCMLVSYRIGGTWSVPAEMTLTIEPLPLLSFVTVPVQVYYSAKVNVEVEPVPGVVSYVYQISRNSALSDSGICFSYESNQAKTENDSIYGWRDSEEFTEGYYYLSVTGRDENGEIVARSQDAQINIIRINPGNAPEMTVYAEGTPITTVMHVKIRLGREDYERFQIITIRDGQTIGDRTWVNPGSEIISSYEAGEYVLRGRALSEEGVWSEWTEVSFTVVAGPSLDHPGNVVVPGSVNAYENFSISFDAADNARYYEIYLMKAGDDSIYGTVHTEATSTTMSGWNNELTIGTGEYLLWIHACANGYEDGIAGPVAIHIDGTEERPERPVLSILEGQTLYEDSQVFFSIDKEYTDLRIVGTNTRQIYATNPRRADGAAEDGAWLRGGEAGEWKARACYADSRGIWSDWSEWTEYTLVERGKLREPVITCEENYSAGSEVAFSVSYDERSTGHRIAVYLSDEEGDHCIYEAVQNGANPDDPEMTVIPEDAFDQGSYYILASQYDDSGEFGSSSSTDTFTVTGSRPEAPELIMDQTEGKAGESLVGKVTTEPGASSVQYRTNYLGAEKTYRASSGTTVIAVLLTDRMAQEDHHVSVRALYPEGWSSWSEWTNLTVQSDQAEKPSQWMPVLPTVLTPGKNATVVHPDVQGAKKYTVILRELNRNEIRFSEEKESAGPVTIPGICFGDGGNYSITALVSNGKDEEWLQTEKQYYDLRAYEGEPVYVTMDKTEFEYQESIQAVLSVTNATKVAIRETAGGKTRIGFMKPAEGGIISFRTDYQGTVELRFAALTDGEWSGWSEGIEISVGEPLGILDGMNVRLPRSAYYGEPLTITWDEVTAAELYYLFLETNRSSAVYKVTGTSYTVPADEMKTDWMEVYGAAYAENYLMNSSVIRQALRITDPGFRTRTAALPKGLKTLESEALSGIKAAKIIVPDGCEAIGANAFNNCDGLLIVFIPETVSEISKESLAGCEHVIIQTPEGSRAAAIAAGLGMDVTFTR